MHTNSPSPTIQHGGGISFFNTCLLIYLVFEYLKSIICYWSVKMINTDKRNIRKFQYMEYSIKTNNMKRVITTIYLTHMLMWHQTSAASGKKQSKGDKWTVPNPQVYNKPLIKDLTHYHYITVILNRLRETDVFWARLESYARLHSRNN